MTDMMADIVEFHVKFGLHPVAAVPALLPTDVAEFRVRFMHEELMEYIAAAEQGDIAGCADALVDLVYVALGTAYLHGFPMDALWDAVQAANMKKVRASNAAASKRGTAMDVVKPIDWTAPDMLTILIDHGYCE